MQVIGFAGNDTLTAMGGDLVYGLAGDDVLIVRGADNYLSGGAGNDTLDYGFAAPISGMGVFVLVDWGETYRGELDALPWDSWFWEEWTNWLVFADDFSEVENVSGSAFGDILIGDNSRNSLLGRDGGDTLWGEGGSDFIRGGAGADSLWGGADFDDLHGNQGDDTVAGGDGGDWVVGGQDSDLLFGEAGDDYIVANLGADTCHGGEGRDTLLGGQADDVLFGDGGADWLSGDRGVDVLTGGEGADTFRFFSGSGADVITDFAPGEGDRILIEGAGAWSVVQFGQDVVVTYGQAGDSITLADVSLSSLGNGFILAG